MSSFYNLPSILIIHLKRFKSNWYMKNNFEKDETKISIEEDIDLSKFVHSNYTGKTRYKLYAISNHKGTLEAGHYTR